MAGRPAHAPDSQTYSGQFAANLRRLREKQRTTVIEFAEAVGVAPTTVYQWEQGTRQPDYDTLPKIAAALGKVGVRGIMP